MFIILLIYTPIYFSIHHNTFSRTKDDKAEIAAEDFQAAPIVATPTLPSSSSRGDTSMPEEMWEVSSKFWQQWHSPQKQKEEETSCTDMVVWSPPAASSKPTLKRQMAKVNLEIGEDRPTLRRQMAKSTFDLDSSDMQTLALALQSKALEAKQKIEVEKKTSKAKAGKKIYKKPSLKPKEKKVEDPQTPTKERKKSTFRHRKTSTAYHHAKNMALKSGYSPNSAKAQGRAASGQVSMQIESGVLKEEDEEQ